MKISFKMIKSFLLLFLFSILSIIFTEIHPLFVTLVSIWIICIVYAFDDLDNRGMLFSFFLCFFVFLIGRDFVKQYFKYGLETFYKDENIHAWMSYIISLVTILSGYILFTNDTTYDKEKKLIQHRDLNNIIYKKNIRKISILIYYISILFAVITQIEIIKFVSKSSFTDYYVDYAYYLKNNSTLYFISKVESVMPVAWAVYLGTGPDKKDMRFPLTIYFIYLMITLGTGQRSKFMLGILTIFTYYTLRNQEGEIWVSKKMMFKIVLSLPFLAMFISLYDIWREGNPVESINFFESIIKFFYDQGVTSNIVKRAYTYKDIIPDQIYTLEFFHSGILARIFDIPVYHGNTIEHALYGGSFTHSLAYVVMESSYLSGRGTGSCYIAELYQDFGYLGVIIGNLIYSFIIAKLSNLSSTNYIRNGYKLFIMPYIFWAVRASFTYFLSQTLSPITIVTFLIIFITSKLMLKNNIKKISISL